jgi:hypothetical protein
MDAYLSALAALAGTAVGGLTSFFSSWLGQSAQLKAQLFLQEKDRRQELYRDFVDEASRFYIDALTNDQPDVQDDRHLRSGQPDAHPIVVEGRRGGRQGGATDRGLLPQAQ